MKKILAVSSLFLCLFFQWGCAGAQKTNNTKMSSIHQFSIEGLTGGTINFADFKGKKILIVNVASECGFTPQYKDLQALQERYADKLVVIGMPCNDFGGQEPGTGGEIQQFCQKNYGVTFPITTKVKVKGDEKHQIYDWLTHKDKNGVKNAHVLWNFHKFILDEQGFLIDDFGSMRNPLDGDITEIVTK
jgi:glutathione peroxidase